MPVEYTQRRVKCRWSCGHNLRDSKRNRELMERHEARCPKCVAATQVAVVVAEYTFQRPWHDIVSGEEERSGVQASRLRQRRGAGRYVS